jgi:ABC-type sugar transport system ATPase subunit
VMLARAMVRRAEIWLLDEPLAQLDSALAGQLSQDLHLLQKASGHTIFHVSHDPIEAMALADRVGLLGGGRILQTGNPDEVYSRPGSRTVGLHFGRPPMSLIDGVADAGEFRSLDGWVRVACPHLGKVTLGVRPEDVTFSPRDGFVSVGDAEIADSCRVDARTLVTVRGSTSEVRGFTEVPGTGRITVRVNPNRLHWFDSANGARLEVKHTVP